MPEDNNRFEDKSFFEAKGFSMHPFVRNEDKIIVMKVNAKDLIIGDIILYEYGINDQKVCHRFVGRKNTDDGFMLFTRGDAGGLSEPIKESCLIGRVSAILRDGKVISLRTRKQIFLNWLNARFYVFFRPVSISRARFSDLLKFMAFVSPDWKMQLFTIALSLIIAPLGIAIPYLTKLVIDNAFGNRDLGLFVWFSFFGFVLFMLMAIIGGVRNLLEQKLWLKVNFDLNKKVFESMQNFSLSFFKDKSTGEHIYKINFDIDRVTHLITQTLSEFILSAGKLLLIFAVVFYLNWRIALLGLFFAPFLYLQSYFFAKKRKRLMQKQIGVSESIFVKLEEVFSHIHLIKAFGREEFEINDYLKRLMRKIELSLQDLRIQFFSSFSGDSLRKVVLGLISLYAGFQIIKGEISLGSFTAIMIYFTQLIGLQSAVGGFFQQLAFDFVSCDRLNEILKKSPEIRDSENASVIEFSKTDIEFKDVIFGYKPDSTILENLSFFIKRGSFIALVGKSGCGKTTLLNLIARLYEVNSGKILIGGFDIQDIKLNCLKDQIGIALQEPFLWNDTVLNNIRYARQEATLEEIKRAAEIAEINDFIESLPQGYDTMMGEMASKISQGQKQRMAIARAVIKKPKILILDEAMSSLDSETEDRIIENLRSEFKSSAVIIVTHRLSAVKKMDLIYYLEAPDKIDIGSHGELLERNPGYRDLFSGQLETEKNWLEK